MKNETLEILKQADRIKAINQELSRELAALENTFYCTECESECGETCRDCGGSADVVEICGVCRESLDNCNCEVVS